MAELEPPTAAPPQQGVSVVYEDGTVVDIPEARPADVVAFERRFKMPAAVMDNAEEAHLDWVMFMSWSALRRATGESRSYDEWLDSLVEIRFPDPPAAEAHHDEVPTLPPPA